jgi:hypothetical protein
MSAPRGGESLQFTSPQNADVTQRLLQSAEPSVRLQVLSDVLGQPSDSRDVRRLREQVRMSSRVAMLLSERDERGRIPHHPYSAKWHGAHWVLVALAELCYPPGNESLVPLRDQIMGWLFSGDYERRTGRVHGLPTLHASIDGNAVWSALSLGIADERTEPLVQRLLDTQWPDGGWNCDRKLKATHSSFHESFAPVVGLAVYAQATGDDRAEAASARGAEFFLRHHVFCSERTGEPWPKLEVLRYPPYWHYDALAGLTMLRRSVGLADQRVQRALDLLHAKRRHDGTWRTEGRWWKPPGRAGGNVESVAWNGTANELLTVRALAALAAAGRL